MFKKIAVFASTLALAVGIAALATATPAQAKGCHRGSHLVDCGSYSFCCPDNALCVCL